MMENAITVYGTAWCRDCFRVCRIFDKYNIAYRWVDIDRDEFAQDFVKSTNHGFRSVPTIVLNDGSILVEPSDFELRQLLDSILASG